jgi:GNAT superfamily N-acetyltransferase
MMAVRLKRILNDADHAVRVAADDEGKAIGWVHVRLALTLILDREAEIDGLVVREDHRGRGIGAQLLQDAQTWANRHDCSAVRLRTNVTRGRAHRFYERCGFKRVKTSYLFRKALTPSYDDDGLND